MSTRTTKNLVNALLSLLLVPWQASTLWFWLDGIVRARDFDIGMIIGIIPFAMAYGVIGMLVCLVVTVPFFLVSSIVFNRFPNISAKVGFRRTFVGAAALTGLGLSLFGSKLLNTGRIEFLLLIIGVASGVVLASATLWIWRILPEDECIHCAVDSEFPMPKS